MRSLRRGLVAGALAGAWVAFADFGATWLWLPLARDRALLLVRLLASLVPVGALLGALLAGCAAAWWKRVATHRLAAWLFPVPFVLVGAAPAHWLALKLCSGGSMSRLAQRWPLEAALTMALPALLYAALALGALAWRWCAQEPRRATRPAWLLLALAFGAGKANQLILPNLYEYLHALLALVAWGLAALGLGVLALHTPRAASLAERLTTTRASLALAAALIALASWNALTLDQNLNVRVALFEARSPTSRALLAGVDPWLRALEPRTRPGSIALAARERRGGSAPASAPGAHVLLVTIDALRADHLGAYGYARPVSPQLDALSRESLLFERAYAQAPHSSYSLSSLHTSEYVHETVELGRPLPSETLAAAFKAHGYHTAAFFTDGIFHTEGQKLSALRDSAFGFALFDHTNREAEEQTDRVLAELARLKERGDPPTLFWVHYFDVHEPYQATTFGSGEMDRYDSEILHVDRELSRLIRELRARSSRPLVVAISADHGEEFRDHGGVYHGSTLYDEQVRVPLIVQVPGLAATRVAAPVEVIDIAPTLLATVGAPIPRTMRGRDLRALAATPGAAPSPVFSAVLTKRMALLYPHKLIADLRFGLYELYDLERDPKERRNLAGQEPARLEALRAHVYGWLDALEARDEGTPDDTPEAGWQRALRLGRLGDRRAAAPTSALLLDRAAPTAMRVEAGQILAKLADPSGVDALMAGLDTQPAEVAAEAAIALGRMYDERARDALRRLMHVEDPHVRARAAVSLGRLRDRAAVPALIDALWVAPTQYEREEAVRWLGRLRDPAAVEPLLSLLPEFGLRYLLAVALGEIGDPRAYDALIGMLEWESRTNIRDEVVRGLGLLGDVRAIPTLVRLLESEPGLRNTAESLVRLDAPTAGALGGVDVGPRTRGMSGLAQCVEGPLRHDWDYTERTHCTTSGKRAQLTLPLPEERALWASAQLVVRARRVDVPEPTSCALRLSGHPLTALRVDGVFREQRWSLSSELLRDPRQLLMLECEEDAARLRVDHALIVPRLDATARAEPSAEQAGEPTHAIQ